VVLDDVDLEGDLRGNERLRQVIRLGGGEGVVVLLPLLLPLLLGRALRVVGDGDGDGAPVGALAP
jgi:hypothetical protein